MKLSFGDVLIVKGKHRNSLGQVYQEGRVYYDLFIKDVRFYVKKEYCIRLPHTKVRKI